MRRRPARAAAGEQRHRLRARKRHGNCMAGELRLDRVEPGRIVAVVFEQPVALRQQPLEVARAAAMRGVDGQHQAIEEAAALASRPGEEPVHRRRQPEHAQIFEQRVGADDAGAPLTRTLRARASPARAFGEAGAEPRVSRRPARTSPRPPSLFVAPIRVISSKLARRSPRPGVSSEIASRRLVFPTPFAPVSTMMRESSPRTSEA